MTATPPTPLDPTAIDAPLGPRWCAAWTEVVDTALAADLARTDAGGRAVVAVGGYGRRQLCPSSDIDVVLLHDGRRRERLDELVGALCYPLWDAGLRVGHSVLTAKEAVRGAGASTETATSLLSRRFVAGDRGLFDELGGRMRRWQRRNGGKLLAALGTHDRRPTGRLEPDLKTDAGGIRCLHRLSWAADCLLGDSDLAALVGARFLGAGEHKVLMESARTLLAARCALHLTDSRAGDRLRLDLHDEVAARLELTGGDELLRCVGLAMRSVSHAHARAWPALQLDATQGRRRARPPVRELDDGVRLDEGFVELDENRDPRAEPSLGLRAVAAGAREGARLGRGTLERLRRALVGARLPWDEGTRSALLDILRAGLNAPEALDDADQSSVLAALLPEWPRVRGRPQRNPFHIYDLDTHLAQTVAWLGRLRSGELDADHAARWRGLEDPDAVLLGAWLHDIGKAWPGDHSVVGAKVAGDWVRAMGFSDERAERVAILVRHHLLLADAATRRDLDEVEEIHAVAAAAGDTEALDGLLLLSLADARATGPSVHSPWKDSLLATLHRRVRARLHDDAVSPGRPDETARAVHRTTGEPHAPAVERLLDGLPRRYLVAASTAQVLAHASLLEACGKASLACAWRDGEVPGTAVLSVIAADRLGLLADVAGVLSGFDLDILDARAVTRSDGMAVDWFTVLDAGAQSRADAARTLQGGLVERGDVAALVAARERRRDAKLPREAALAERSVVVDDDGGRQLRVEATAPNAPGLVFRLAGAAADAGWSVAGLKAEALGAQARVVFFLGPTDRDAAVDLAELLGAAADPPPHLMSSVGASRSVSDPPPARAQFPLAPPLNG